MTSMRNIYTLTLCLILGQSIARASDAVPLPSVPLRAEYNCPLTMLQTQALAKSCKLGPDGKAEYECDGIKVEAGCGGWHRLPGFSIDTSGLSFLYYIDNLERNETRRYREGSLYREPFSTYLSRGAGSQLMFNADNTLSLSPDGIPQLSNDVLDGDCGQEKTRRVEVTPIQGANWSGWMYEQVFAAPKKKLPSRCQKFTPQYRCVTLLFGNNKVSASMPNYCFLRKKVNNLRVELSFDVFMDMIKTIKFEEGEVVPLQLIPAPAK